MAKKSARKRGAKKARGARGAQAFLGTAVASVARPRSGRMSKGRSFNLPQSAPGAAAAAGPDEGLAYDRPRPSPTRYPIDMPAFLAMKRRVESSRLRLAKGATTVVADRPAGREPQAAPAAGAAAEMAGVPLMAPAVSMAPTSVSSFPGITATGWLPPDCTLAAGPAHVLISVNASVAIYAKAGGAALKQVTLTTWFANVIAQAKIFDPKALYDQHAGRWVLLAVALGPVDDESSFLLSISKTADPLGGWWNYRLDAAKDGTTPTSNWADYPGLGLDSVALYLTANMFAVGGSFRYAKVRVVPKAGPYAGAAATFFDLVKLKHADGSMAFTVQPCHTFGAPAAEYLVSSVYPSANGTASTLSLWSVANPATAPTLIRLTITTDPFALPPDADQKGGNTPLDTGDTRVLNAVCRGGSVWCTLTTAHDYGGGNRAACHWFQITAATGALVQQGVFGASAQHCFYPAVFPDSNGNVTLVFSRSGKAEFAGARFTGRKASDPPGKLQGSRLLQAGAANYVGLDGMGRNRWGDYAGAGSDPADGLKTWVYSMHAAAGNHWATYVGLSKF